MNLLFQNKEFKSIAETVLTKRTDKVHITGIDRSASSFFIAALQSFTELPSLIIVRDSARAERVISDLLTFMDRDMVNLLPAKEYFINPDALFYSEDIAHQRLRFINWLQEKKKGVYVATIQSLMAKLMPHSEWYNLSIPLLIGERINREDLLAKLVAIGYKRASLTEQMGCFSARGEIVDIFPPGWDAPVRIELDHDVIGSIRSYDFLTQRSYGESVKCLINPAKEVVMSKQTFQAGKVNLLTVLDSLKGKELSRTKKEALNKLTSQVMKHLDRLEHPDGLELLSNYFPFFYQEAASLIDYLPQKFLVFIEEEAMVKENSENIYQDVMKSYDSVFRKGDLPGEEENFLWRADELLGSIRCPVASCSLYPPVMSRGQAGDLYEFKGRLAASYYGQWDILNSDLKSWFEQGYNLFLFTGREDKGAALFDLMASHQKEGNGEKSLEQKYLSAITILPGVIEEGFCIDTIKGVCLTEQNLLPGKKKARVKYREKKGIKDYRELAIGDYVVHDHHGIGRYTGLEILAVNGIKREYIKLQYKGTDKIYLPVDQVGLIEKYSAGDNLSPPLHSLGGNEWTRIKKRVSAEVEKLAKELLTLYAARSAVKGYSFAPDHPWQLEFESQFPYEETPDQLQAINDVKNDLEKPAPMDRLVCGDVGYGKTEIALRAAFKVIMEGKQVAILVPTTVLARQHYETFKERFEKFPVKVAQLSRFVPPKQRILNVSDLASGNTDIIIGTHRLLSRDIRFKNLGLIVIDEEHRFGVRQKEKMKRLRLEVDTLAMSATPIPRTLNLSLSGVRDFSIIDTPPENRYPIHTFVQEYSDQDIFKAIQFELSRGGQVFVVSSRIHDIDRIASTICSMFPETAVAVGHGRLAGRVLERVMADFQSGLYKILISTTIIESGLDIPNVNTLIVIDADRFGLAQLYQIRGRVGRSGRVAYAYLTYRKNKVLKETAQKRLRAIREFVELGSGYKIALRDLEIRGAGNILGAEQHGYIAAVGFGLYCRLLEQAVAELKDEKIVEKIYPRLDLQANAFIPDKYIPVADQKIDFYQRIFNASTAVELKQVEEELKDRYGSIPAPVRNLFLVGLIRHLAYKLGIVSIQQNNHAIIIHSGAENKMPVNLREVLKELSPHKFLLVKEKPLQVKLSGELDSEQMLMAIKEMLDVISVKINSSAC